MYVQTVNPYISCSSFPFVTSFFFLSLLSLFPFVSLFFSVTKQILASGVKQSKGKTTGAGKGGGKSKKNKGPKKARGPYAFFVQNERVKIAAANPGACSTLSLFSLSLLLHKNVLLLLQFIFFILFPCTSTDLIEK